jgi:hypothetical protein
MAIGGIIKIAVTWILVSNPDIAYAAPRSEPWYAILLSADQHCEYLFGYPGKTALGKIFVKPVVATCVMGLSAYLSYHALQRLFAGIGMSPDEGCRC